MAKKMAKKTAKKSKIIVSGVVGVAALVGAGYLIKKIKEKGGGWGFGGLYIAGEPEPFVVAAPDEVSAAEASVTASEITVEAARISVTAQQDIVTLQEGLAAYQEQYSTIYDTIATLEEDILAAEEELAPLQEAYDDRLAKIAKWEGDYARISASLETWRIKRSRLEWGQVVQISEADAAIDQRIGWLNETQVKLNASYPLRDDLADQILVLNTEIAGYTASKSNYTAALEVVTIAMNTLQGQIDTLQAQINAGV